MRLNPVIIHRLLFFIEASLRLELVELVSQRHVVGNRIKIKIITAQNVTLHQQKS